MITLTQLEYIVAIDEYRHFATAAEKCFVTQPTLSMQIKKLEDELGVIIFDRSRQPVVPTDLGAKLIEQARMTLSATQRIKEIIQEEKARKHKNKKANNKKINRRIFSFYWRHSADSRPSSHRTVQAGSHSRSGCRGFLFRSGNRRRGCIRAGQKSL